MEDDDAYGDVLYWVWKRGGNPDLVDRDRVDQAQDDGATVDEIASREYRRQQPRHEDERTDDVDEQ